MKVFSLALLSVVVATCSLGGAVPVFGTVQPAVVDVALGESGAMVGQLVDAQGIGLAQQEIVLFQGNREIARARTDTQGHFRVDGLRGGVYQLVAAEHTVVTRAWAPGTEPPVAQRGVLMVAGGNEVYRGQQGGTPIRNFLTHPLTLTAGVATAIAVPVALHNTRRKPKSPD